MLSKAQEKLIRSLHTNKGREKSGLCLVEGQKLIDAAGDLVEYTFAPHTTSEFSELVTTETPQDRAGVARIPTWNPESILHAKTIVLLDGVQDPGNVGTILRLCLGFKATLILVESVDPTNPKVIRASAGAVFHTPWMRISRKDAEDLLAELHYPVLRLEAGGEAEETPLLTNDQPTILIAGSEGQGIKLEAKGTSLTIKHNDELESLNVSHALAIALHTRYQNTP